jgi:hypothetical protein
MGTALRWAALASLACALAACKREAAPVSQQPSPPPPAAVAPTSPPPAPAQADAAAKPSPVESVAVTATTLGSAVNAEKRVTAASDTFGPGDTIFVSVETSGAGGANLTARWTFLGTPEPTRVNEETQKVPAGGPSITEFHVRKPDGWPRGDYQVAVVVNDEVAATRKFSVK